MKIYANLDELVPHLGEIDGWLYVDEDRWAQNPAAEIYLFAEEEAEYWDTHADCKDFDDARYIEDLKTIELREIWKVRDCGMIGILMKIELCTIRNA